MTTSCIGCPTCECALPAEAWRARPRPSCTFASSAIEANAIAAARPIGHHRPMESGPSFAVLGALLGDPARANMLDALTDGRAFTAKELAWHARVAPPTASSHLAKLLVAGLVAVERSGRHRFYRIADPALADLLEQLAVYLPAPQPGLEWACFASQPWRMVAPRAGSAGGPGAVTAGRAGGSQVLDVLVKRDRIHFGERLVVSFHRTLRLPDDGRTYPLPAGLGLLPIVAWQHDGRDELLVPLYRREALWLGFSGAIWQPNALKVMVGGINAVSGLPDEAAALGAPQDYLVCPLQPWLDGFNAGDGTIRQFVAMPLGEGYAIEAGHGLPERGGLRLVAYEPRPGRFPDEPPPAPRGPVRFAAPQAAEPHAMVLGAGGRMRQKIYPDPQGADAWDPDRRGEARVALVAAPDFALLTGRAPPPTPIDSETYARAGLPWFDLYDEAAGSVGPAGGAPPRTVRERDRERRPDRGGDQRRS